MKQWFGRCVVISLPQRSDRLKRFYRSFECGLDWTKRPLWDLPTLVKAVDGSTLPLPEGWKLHGQHNNGRGALGCLRSHVRVLEDTMQAGADSVLVFEDDAVFCKDSFGGQLERFMSRVPADWDCIMLGGGHSSQPTLIDDRQQPHVVKCFETHRTHAYAVRGQFMRDLYVAWIDAKGHCDHVLGSMMRSRKVYAPFPFLVGQGEGESDISGQHNLERFWESPTGTEPMVWIDPLADPAIVRKLCDHHELYLGSRLNDIGQSISLGHIAAITGQTERMDRLTKWIAERQSECLTTGAILGVWHSGYTLATVARAWPTVVELDATTVEAGARALECLRTKSSLIAAT